MLPSSNPNDAAVVENLLKLDGGGAALTRCQIRLAAYIHMVEAGRIGNERNLSQFDRSRSRQGI